MRGGTASGLIHAELGFGVEGFVAALGEFAAVEGSDRLERFTLFFGQLGKIGALAGAALPVFFCTIGALDEEEMAGVVGAVGVVITGLAALVAFGDDFVGDAFAKAFVEDEIFTDKFIGQAELLALAGIFDDAAFHHEHVVESFVQHVGAGFFAADTAGAIHDDIAVFFVFEQLFDMGECFAEGDYFGEDGLMEMTDFAFVVVAHIDDDGVGVGGQFIEFDGVEGMTALRDIEGGVIKTIGYDFVANFHFEFVERLAVVIDSDVESDAVEGGGAVEQLTEAFKIGFRYGYLGVDTFLSYIDAAPDAECDPFAEGLIAEYLRVLDVPILIEGKRNSFFVAFVHTTFEFVVIDEVKQSWHGEKKFGCVNK